MRTYRAEPYTRSPTMGSGNENATGAIMMSRSAQMAEEVANLYVLNSPQTGH